MNLRQLEAFRAVYMTGSVSRAAEALHVSQPSVSRLIGDLEASIKIKLFTRTARGLQPTPEAQQLYRVVDRAFVGLAEINEAALALRTLKSGAISLVVVPAFAFTVVPDAIGQQHAQLREIRYNVSISTSRAAIDSVQSGKADLGLISPIGDYRHVHTLFSVVMSYLCVLPDSHRLAHQRKPIDLLDLEDEEFVSFDRSYLQFLGVGPDLLEFIQSRSRISSHSAPVIAALARATGAIAIVDPITAALVQSWGGVVCRPMKQKLRYEAALIASSEESVSLIGREFAGIIEQAIKDRVSVFDRM